MLSWSFHRLCLASISILFLGVFIWAIVLPFNDQHVLVVSSPVPSLPPTETLLPAENNNALTELLASFNQRSTAIANEFNSRVQHLQPIDIGELLTTPEKLKDVPQLLVIQTNVTDQERIFTATAERNLQNFDLTIQKLTTLLQEDPLHQDQIKSQITMLSNQRAETNSLAQNIQQYLNNANDFLDYFIRNQQGFSIKNGHLVFVDDMDQQRLSSQLLAIRQASQALKQE